MPFAIRAPRSPRQWRLSGAHQRFSYLRRSLCRQHKNQNLSENATVLRVYLVRNPYERMLSAYLDKLVHAHAMAIVPNGLKTNSSFAEFVYAAIDESKRKRGPDWHFSHYYPISRLKIYRPCVDPTVTRYKVEEIASWYG